MAVLVDTNVLIFSIRAATHGNRRPPAALEALLESNEDACVFLQNIAEFWNVCTRPANRNGLGLDVVDTARRLAELDSILTVVRDSHAVYRVWPDLLGPL